MWKSDVQANRIVYYIYMVLRMVDIYCMAIFCVTDPKRDAHSAAINIDAVVKKKIV